MTQTTARCVEAYPACQRRAQTPQQERKPPVVGGIYGIGGGSLLSPILVGRGFPISTVAPAALTLDLCHLHHWRNHLCGLGRYQPGTPHRARMGHRNRRGRGWPSWQLLRSPTATIASRTGTTDHPRHLGRRNGRALRRPVTSLVRPPATGTLGEVIQAKFVYLRNVPC